MTYLELVNSVLRRMREDTVSDITDSAYSQMVSDYVNDAKNEVELAWNWSHLRTTINVETLDDGTTVYALIDKDSLEGLGSNWTFLSLHNTTQNTGMTYKPTNWMHNRQDLSTVPSGPPVFFTFDGVDDSGNTQINVYPTPDAVYNLRMRAVRRQAELSDKDDVLLVPWRPVMHLAHAYVNRERGESGSLGTDELFAMAQRALSDEIALDAAHQPEELIFRVE